jgi:predicted RNA-binding Zn ribbon-like protein
VDDLDLAVDLVNTVNALTNPSDQLTDVPYFQRRLIESGESRLAEELAGHDLQPLRILRDRLRGVFLAASPSDAVPLLNALLRETNAVPQMTVSESGKAFLGWEADRFGYSALAARLPGALTMFVTVHGVRRLGVCGAAPCECVFVDRTRPGNRRYCSEQCNDRASAAAYRGRQKAS